MFRYVIDVRTIIIFDGLMYNSDMFYPKLCSEHNGTFFVSICHRRTEKRSFGRPKTKRSVTITKMPVVQIFLDIRHVEILYYIVSAVATTPNNETTSNSTNSNKDQLSPTNGIASTVTANLAMTSVSNAGRKRPLLAGGPRTSMTPTKRTVMSLLARARAAQAKQLPTTFQRGTPE